MNFTRPGMMSSSTDIDVDDDAAYSDSRSSVPITMASSPAASSRSDQAEPEYKHGAPDSRDQAQSSHTQDAVLCLLHPKSNDSTHAHASNVAVAMLCQPTTDFQAFQEQVRVAFGLKEVRPCTRFTI